MDSVRVCEVFIVDDLVLSGGVDAVPISMKPDKSVLLQGPLCAIKQQLYVEAYLHGVPLCLVIKIATEEGEEVVHLSLEKLPNDLVRPRNEFGQRGACK